jgi:hypothetical protein
MAKAWHMKYNINVIKSVWRRLRKPSRATLGALCSKDAVQTEVLSQTDIFCERWKHLSNPKDFPERPLSRPLESPLQTSWCATGMAPQTKIRQQQNNQ